MEEILFGTEIRRGRSEDKKGETVRKDKEILIDSYTLLYMQRLSFFFVGVKDRKRGREEHGGGGDTSGTDRKTGRRRWEMERKGGEREQERALLPSLNLSCSDQ